MYGHTVMTLLCKYVMSLTTNLSAMCFLLLNNVLIEEVKQNLKFLKGHMMNRILHSWSFHMEFIKLVKACFINPKACFINFI